MSLHDAIQDCKEDALAGKTINFVAIAADYGLNPKLVERKYQESFPNGPTRIKSADDFLAEKIEAEVQECCKRYGVARSRCKVETIRGERYTVIGRWRTRILGVSHTDGVAYKISGAR